MTSSITYQGDKQKVYKFIDSLDPTQKWTITARLYKEKRSLDQNERYWALITDFGNFCGYDKDEMHQLIGRKFLSYEKKAPDGRIRKFIKSTTKLNTAEMVELQENIERIAAEQGFIFEGIR